MPFNINDFKSVMNKHGGPGRTSLFEVEITPTSIGGNVIVPNVITTSDLRFFCQSVSVPGINLETAPYRSSGIGLPESMPMTIQPEALNAVFLLDSNHRVMTFFHRWINTVMNVGGARGDNSFGLPMHQIEYKSVYAASSMTIRHYSTYDPFNFYEFQYYGVYPTQVSNIDMSWSSKNEPATVTVNFSYSKMLYQGFKNGSFETSNNFVGSQNSVARGPGQPQFITDFNQRQVDQLTVI